MRAIRNFNNDMRRFINFLPKGALFVSRDLLAFAPRDSVDQFVFVSVKNGYLVRATRGVFYRNLKGLSRPTVEAIVKAKARAFSREVSVHSRDWAAKLGMVKQGQQGPTFASTGSTTSFCIMNRPILLKGTAPRKIIPLQKSGSQFLQALWHVGEKQIGKNHIRQQHAEMLRQTLNLRTRKQLRMHFKWMPQWMSDFMYELDWLWMLRNPENTLQSFQETCYEIAHFGSFAQLDIGPK